MPAGGQRPLPAPQPLIRGRRPGLLLSRGTPAREHQVAEVPLRPTYHRAGTLQTRRTPPPEQPGQAAAPTPPAESAAPHLRQAQIEPSQAQIWPARPSPRRPPRRRYHRPHRPRRCPRSHHGRQLAEEIRGRRPGAPAPPPTTRRPGRRVEAAGDPRARGRRARGRRLPPRLLPGGATPDGGREAGEDGGGRLARRVSPVSPPWERRGRTLQIFQPCC